ncbi:uncharacterized protein [Apostichopus japonicus]|uniref:uncharacterized protein isoform X2 n=1 Tax=Stichopus japonicus TaxID=307972 RepID=UPI003AB2F90C
MCKNAALIGWWKMVIAIYFTFFLFNKISSLNGQVTPVRINETVVRGSSPYIYCIYGGNQSDSPIWKFNEEVLFASDFSPGGIGVENVEGKINDTYSFLHFQRFSSDNVGTYQCLYGTETLFTYTLNIKDPSITVLCMEKECPSLLILKEFTSYNFQCYSDLVDPIIKYKWKVNGIDTLQGVEEKLFQVNTTKEQIFTSGSVLSLFIRRNHDNITCLLGNNSKLVYIHVAPSSFDSNIIVMAYSGTGFLAFVFLVCAITCGCVKCNSLQRNVGQLQSHITTLQMQSNDNTSEESSFYGSLTEYDDVVNPYEGENEGIYSRDNICFLTSIDSVPGICRWAGKLSRIDSERLNVAISYVEADAPAEAKRLWHSCSNTKLKLAKNQNIVNTLGYCVLYIIQEYFEMTSLSLHLVSDYANFGEVMHQANLDDSLRYGLGIVNGMEFLTYQGCCHPGLCIKHVLVDMSDTCKLHNFCCSKDAETFLKMNIKRDEDSLWSLAPESKSSDTYTMFSDIWAIGITFWEIFLGSDKLQEIVASHEFEMQKQLSFHHQQSDISQKLSSIMKLCLTYRPDDRPSVREIKKVMENRQSCVIKEERFLTMEISPFDKECNGTDIYDEYDELG